MKLKMRGNVSSSSPCDRHSLTVLDKKMFVFGDSKLGRQQQAGQPTTVTRSNEMPSEMGSVYQMQLLR